MFRRAGVALLVLGVGLVLALRPLPRAQAVDTCPGRASTLIQLVNNLRQNLGLAPYEIHPIVMSVAQGHSNYQAEIDTLTHIGPGGSRPKDRLRAAGYGGGGHILASENIAWGYDMPPQGAMDLWIPSPIHYQTMTSTRLRHVGAGCATSSTGKTYYTLLAAWHPGVPVPPQPTAPPPAASPTPLPTPTGPTPTPSPVPVIPSTPRPDGAVVHVVQPGQTLMMIALSYRVPLEQVLELNNLTRTSIIRPGDEIMVIPPKWTPTPTVASDSAPVTSPAATDTAAPTATAFETSFPVSPTPSLPATSPASPTGIPAPTEVSGPSTWLLVLVMVGGWLLPAALAWVYVMRRGPSHG